MSTSIVDVITHYQRNIERCQDDESRLLHCINKLYKLPVKVEHLQETGVGKTVNALRKFNGEIGVAAKTLVTKWKAMVAAEEEPMETDCQPNEEEANSANSRRSSSDGDDDDKGHQTKEKTDDVERHSARHSSKKSDNSKEHKESKSENRDKRKSHSSSHHGTHTHRESTSSRHNSNSRHHDTKKDHSQSHKTHEKHEKSHHRSSETDHSDHGHGKDRERGERHKKEVKPTREERRKEEQLKENRKREEKHREQKEKKEEKASEDAVKKTNSSGSSSAKSKTDDDNGGKSSSSSTSSSSSSSDSHKHEIKEKSHKSREKENKHKDSEKHSTSKDMEKHIRKRSKDEKVDREKISSKEKERNDKKQSSNSKACSSTKNASTSPEDSSTTHSRSHCSERKRHNIDDIKKEDLPKAKKTRVVEHKSDTNNDDDDDAKDGNVDEGIDSSTGANFADVLGRLDLPTKKSKKPLNSFKSPTASTSSGSKSKHDTASVTKENSHKSERITSSKTTSTSATKSSTTSAASSSSSPPSSSSSSSVSNARCSDKKPVLLSTSAKLAPLDPSIALDLPTITNNYKPMPLNQTVMDCVFNNSISSLRPPVRTLTDAEALSHGISSKTMRTKIYSGVKTGQILQAPSLFDLCTRVLQKNIDALEYTGGVPFEVLRQVLERATPQQLLIFEEYNPYVIEDTDELWKFHVQRNYRSQKRQEMESWREMFLRCQDDQERKLNILAESIKQSQKIISAPVRKTQLAFVDSMVKPPRNVLRKQEQYGTKAKLVATPAARVASLSKVTPNAAQTGDARLRVASQVRDNAHVASSTIRPKKAPLMAKTLQFIRGRHKR